MRTFQVKGFQELTNSESLQIIGGKEGSGTIVRESVRGADGRLYSVIKTYDDCGQLTSMSVMENPFG